MPATDWDSYYRQPVRTATFSRRITTNLLVRLIRRFAPEGSFSMAEWGGANSCFLDRMLTEFAPTAYHVLDNNRLGLDLLARRTADRPDVHIHQADVLADPPAGIQADVVYSVGLIEHFDPARTARAIEAHAKLAKPGGIVLLSFPTPTWLYRLSRRIAERAGVWAFPDERPLPKREVLPALARHGRILHTCVNWPICLTQRIVIARIP